LIFPARIKSSDKVIVRILFIIIMFSMVIMFIGSFVF